MSNLFIFSHNLRSLGHFLSCNTKLALAYVKALSWYNRRPRILNFYSSEQLLIQGGILKLVWQTKYTAFVHIEGLGFFINKKEVALPILFEKHSFTLTAYGFLRKSTRVLTLSALAEPGVFEPTLQNCTPLIQPVDKASFQLQTMGFQPRQYQLKLHTGGLQVKHTIKAIRNIIS